MNFSVRHLTVLMALLVLNSGRAEGQDSSMTTSSEYSPHYTSMPFFSEDGRSREIIMPESCLSNHVTVDDQVLQTNQPGCANAYNLQRMVEQEEDLIYGRQLDPAAAAPAARAAQRYIDGRSEPVLGGGVREDRQGHSGAGSMTEE